MKALIFGIIFTFSVGISMAQVTDSTGNRMKMDTMHNNMNMNMKTDSAGMNAANATMDSAGNHMNSAVNSANATMDSAGNHVNSAVNSANAAMDSTGTHVNSAVNSANATMDTTGNRVNSAVNSANATMDTTGNRVNSAVNSANAAMDTTGNHMNSAVNNMSNMAGNSSAWGMAKQPGQLGYLYLPLYKTYVPDDVSTKLKSQYGDGLYSITTIKRTLTDNAYVVRFNKTGQMQTETVDANGTVVGNQ